MKTSAFQFKNPVLMELEFGINKEFLNQSDNEQQISVNMEVQVHRKKEETEAEVSLKFRLGDKDELNPFYIIATEKADFKWKDGLKEDAVKQLLNQNAPSLLLSYLRPIIVQITAASPYNAFSIPFVNFTSEE